MQWHLCTCLSLLLRRLVAVVRSRSASCFGRRGEGRDGRMATLASAEVTARDICDSGFKSDGVDSNTK
jgi:hypothetical protein